MPMLHAVEARPAGHRLSKDEICVPEGINTPAASEPALERIDSECEDEEEECQVEQQVL